jgi:hypothetical protein
MMSDIFEEMEADAQGMQPADQDLRQLANLAEELERVQAQREEKEAELKQVQEQERQLAEHDIPEKLQEIGMEEFTLADGTKVGVKEDVKLSIPKNPEKRSAVFQYLRDFGLGSLIKEEVKTTENPEQAQKALEAAGIHFDVDENAHTGAVKFALKELESEGQDVPWQDLGGYKVRQAKIQRK